MAEFCSTCPNRADCVGPIESVNIISSRTAGEVSSNGQSVSFSIENGIPQGPTELVVQYENAERQASEPVIIYGDTFSEAQGNALAFVDQIDACTQPIKTSRFFGLIVTRDCAAAEMQVH